MKRVDLEKLEPRRLGIVARATKAQKDSDFWEDRYKRDCLWLARDVLPALLAELRAARELASKAERAAKLLANLGSNEDDAANAVFAAVAKYREAVPE
jgi:hypothetical protein